jgi:hypothetical protein
MRENTMSDTTETPVTKTAADEATEAQAAALREQDKAAVLAYRRWEAADPFTRARIRTHVGSETLERGRELHETK